MTSGAVRRFEDVRRVVVKLGTNVLSTTDGVNLSVFPKIADEVATLHGQGKDVVIVTSGAIGFGAKELALPSPARRIPLRQALAAIGQPILMRQYREAFDARSIRVAQILLTREVLDNRTSYLNLRNAMEELLTLGIVPICNENDSVSTAEIGTAFGDNDRLSAYIASKLDADLLVLLTDIDGLYEADPREYPDARMIGEVGELTDEILALAGPTRGAFSTGGMATKLRAVQIAQRAGCRVVIADARRKDVLPEIISGIPVGTVFAAPQALRNRERWILNAQPAGKLDIDAGAVAALRSRKSLLPTGVRGVHGHFEPGSVVELNESAKAVSLMSSSEVRLVQGRHTTEVSALLGPDRPDVIARPEDVVFLR